MTFTETITVNETRQVANLAETNSPNYNRPTTIDVQAISKHIIHDVMQFRRMSSTHESCDAATCTECANPHLDKIILCSDGRVFSDVVGMKDEDVTGYQNEIINMINSLGLNSISTFNLEELYTGLSFDEMRTVLMEQYGEPLELLKASVLLTMYLLIPATRSVSVLGLLPFLIWGAMGWSTMTPQQYRLNQIKPGHDSALIALNSSAVSLGGIVIQIIGLDPKNLPYAAAALIFCALTWQIKLILENKSV